ncbi:uncharacterized protein LOC142893389 isoform X1 [Nelusetta ayraudi]|uniref:uncharacterized protein LOC142893389 isoform X1 n=1 Tax=Nelusetta ayraudi TaxID=303726 RepID=UPI003F6E7A2C
MRLLFSSMLLASLCAPVSQSASVITQSPDVSVMEGEAVNITCCWPEQDERFTLNWMKNQTEMKIKTFLTKQDNEQKSPTCSSLTFESIKREDSGKYTCKLTVEIPKLASYEGNGTIIKVTTKDNTTTTEAPHPGGSSSTYTPVIVLTAVAPLLLIAIICYCKLRRKKASTARVIYEVAHRDSDVTDVDKHSTGSSTGSTHWCQVPVYESFDYFEGVQTKPSG